MDDNAWFWESGDSTRRNAGCQLNLRDTRHENQRRIPPLESLFVERPRPASWVGHQELLKSRGNSNGHQIPLRSGLGLSVDHQVPLERRTQSTAGVSVGLSSGARSLEQYGHADIDHTCLQASRNLGTGSLRQQALGPSTKHRLFGLTTGSVESAVRS